MLLDEIHTYDGTTGAQAAMVLRRWHHSIQAPITFVGLSATLSNPIRHMADLTGVDDELVTSITPDADELEYEGAEYLLALRSDPTSGASVLSTTIQTSMLLPRAQDEPASRISSGVYGTKAFVFTDDLDVTNRLFSYLLDAEGQRYAFGKPKSFKPPLASLRANANGGDVTQQRRAGQLWDLPTAIGHKFATIGEGLRVSRTTSQDSGVTADSQLIVATASLEVGFDDPDVGVVIQHKAPRGVAAFLQRKGRAGRKRTMRPYTAVVLSDYGRDRATYEAWDTLFDPVLPDLVLPIRNRAVLRMQATIAMIDWLTSQLRQQSVPRTTIGLDRPGQKPADSFAKPGRETQLKAVEILNVPSAIRTASEACARGSRTHSACPTQRPTRSSGIRRGHCCSQAIPTLRRRLLHNWGVAEPRRSPRVPRSHGRQPPARLLPDEPLQRTRSARDLREHSAPVGSGDRPRTPGDGSRPDAPRVRTWSRLTPIRNSEPRAPALDPRSDRRR